MTTDMWDIWEPYCGSEYPEEKTAGDIVICDKEPHSYHEKHGNSELGWEWW